MDRKTISTDTAPAAVGAYSQAIRAGEMLFVSGQLGLDPQSKKMVEGGVAAQTAQALTNLEAILKAAGLGMENVVKTTVLLSSIDDFKAVNEVYATRFGDDPPARAAFQAGALPLGGLVEIEAIAVAS
ncbi:MAG: RidA family protein [Polyangia bacterium]